LLQRLGENIILAKGYELFEPQLGHI
jgi:hypothetical protein